MAHPFSFRFDDEDIENDPGEHYAARHEAVVLDSGGEQPTLLEPQLHTLEDLVSSF